MGGAQGLGIQWGGAQAELGRSLWYEASLEEDEGDRRCLEIITVPLGLSPARKQLGSFPWEHLCPTMTEPYRHTAALISLHNTTKEVSQMLVIAGHLEKLRLGGLRNSPL